VLHLIDWFWVNVVETGRHIYFQVIAFSTVHKIPLLKKYRKISGKGPEIFIKFPA